ncbi:MAG: hypothetical protein AAGJ40_00965 [Planctomycetota bacterium]
MNIRALIFACLLLAAGSLQAQITTSGGMGPLRGLTVVIMLGDEYDYNAPPFVDATYVVEAFQREGGPPGTDLQNPDNPTLATVRVDVTTPIGDDSQRTIVAVPPSELTTEQFKEFEQKVRLLALRFGTNSFELLPEEKVAEGDSRIWLRERFDSFEKLIVDARRFREIAKALAMTEAGKSLRPRLDLFQASTGSDSAPGVSDAKNSAVADMTSDMEMDMRMDMGMSMDMDMGTVTETRSIEQLESDLGRIDDARAVLLGRLQESQETYYKAERADLEAVRQELTGLVERELELQDERYQVEIALLNQKVTMLQTAITTWRQDRPRRIKARLLELIGGESK